MTVRTIAAFDPIKSLVRVGAGRGFVVQERENFRQRLTITAAHCLPHIPIPPVEAETFSDVLGPLGGEATVSAECVFVDPVRDVAVLGPPDNQELDQQANAYDALIDPTVPLKISDIPTLKSPTPAYLVALDGHLVDCTAEHLGGPRLLVNSPPGEIAAGMSGSPILDCAGAVIGIVSESVRRSEAEATKGHSPRLVTCLPGWLLIGLGAVDWLKAARSELRAYRKRTMADLSLA
jgi:hypothetical protein